MHFEPSPREVVTAMLELAGVGPADVVYDLGCGDGRIVIEAARRYGARGVCVEIDAELLAEARAGAAASGVLDKVTFRNEDLLQADLAGATVVTLFLSRSMNERLKPKLRRELAPGTRVVSSWHDMGDWTPERTVTVSLRHTYDVYLWRLPGISRP